MDGTLTIPQTNNCARKPGQRKRVRNILIYTNTHIHTQHLKIKNEIVIPFFSPFFISFCQNL